MRRPRPDALVEDLVERPGKVRRAARDWRCPRQHLLAAVVVTPHGRWLYWRGLDQNEGWAVAWRDEVEPVLSPWCNCGDTFEVDVDGTDPARLLR